MVCKSDFEVSSAIATLSGTETTEREPSRVRRGKRRASRSTQLYFLSMPKASENRRNHGGTCGQGARATEGAGMPSGDGAPQPLPNHRHLRSRALFPIL